MSQPSKLSIRRTLGVSVLFACLIVAVILWSTSQDPSAIFQQGVDAYASGDAEALAFAADDLTKHSGYESHVHLLNGLLLYQGGKPREALEELGKARDHKQTEPLALNYTGQILSGLKDYEAAERLLLAAVAADPNLVDPHRFLIALYYDIGAMDNAIKHCDRVIELAPKDMRPWRMSGLILKDFEKYDQAIPSYLGALERSPSKSVEQEIRSELAECYFQVRKQEEALVQLRELPPTADNLSLATECYLALGRTEEARRSLEKALSTDSSHLRTLTVQASLLMEEGDKAKAQEALESAISKHPTDFNLRSMAMQVYQQTGQSEKADREQANMKRLRELKDKFTRLHIQSIQNPRDVGSRVELARTARELGMLEAAVSWYQAALAMQPDHATAGNELRELMAQVLPQPQGRQSQ